MRKQLVSAAVLASLALGIAPAGAATAAPAAQKATVSAAAASAATPTLKPGSRGAAVIRVQRILGIAQTGIFDKATVAAVKKFQKAHGISSSGGYVGPRTWTALRAQEKKQQAALNAAKAAFRKRSAPVSDELAIWVRALANPTVGGVPLPAGDVKLLHARVLRAQGLVAAANKAVAGATTIGQVKVATLQVARVDAALKVVDAQGDVLLVARPTTFLAFVTASMDGELEYAKQSGATIDAAKEATARTAVLKAAAAAQQEWGLIALKLLSIDPLRAGATTQAAALTKSLDKAFDGFAGQQYRAAWAAYEDVLQP